MQSNYVVCWCGRRLKDVEVFTSLVEQTNKLGLEIHGKKTKFMIVSWKPYDENEYVKLFTYNFKIVKDHAYLGTIVASKKELRWEVEKRIRNANRAYYAFLPALKSQSVLWSEKIKICKALIRWVAACRTESWTFNKHIAKWLATFEMKVLRRVFGGIKVN